MQNKIREAVEFIQGKCALRPSLGIILGSGLGGFVESVENPTSISYADIPHFSPTAVQGHAGRLVLGTLRQKKGLKPIGVAVLQGRNHYYEGFSMEEVTLPTRVLGALGVRSLLLTNAAGGTNPAFREADLMLITDHLNLMGINPLRGPNLAQLGPRFPDLSEAYDRAHQQTIREAAMQLDIELREGVYAGLAGPSYETPAEVRMLRLLGADAVGMSTVPECIVANHMGMRVAAVSCITNLAAGITARKLTHEEVMVNAGKAVGRLLSLLNEAIPNLDLSEKTR